ncbi:N-acetylmuramoyl-L-alanine amidase [Dokdonella sp.]|uniref:N-acetylmuramoyl-L-alanine amidase n=1 Tax=Dokdonella sp. TaxID=2291710 RepID=UPI001B0FB107|nr:N-acetylmuramoyl-L-alanine amidase [Dokdonella sp.]MBO9663721.1 N-acetylmuramoyl-L-alanine amidase [Dokdonella sp.]
MRLDPKSLLSLSLLAAVSSQGWASTAAYEPPSATFEAERSAALKPLIDERRGYVEFFRRAYARYPALPAGSLESIAYTQTGWRNVQPADESPADRHMPAAWGPMGLYHGDGFADQVGEGARLTGFSESAVMNDAETNILAAAALLDQAFKQGGKTSARASAEAAFAAALQRYAGFGAAGNLGAYARESFAYSVLDHLGNGVQEDGVEVPARGIDLRKAFPAERLRLLQAPALTVDADRGTVRIDGDSAPSVQQVDAPPTIQAADFGEAIWNPASSSNYSTAGNSDTAVILHTMEGSYAGAIAWFQNPAAEVSAHYLIRKSDGQITQMVREYHQAWHAAYHNYYTIGIEHEGYASDAGNWSSAMVNASARVTRSICTRRGVNCASAWQGPGYDTWHLVPDNVRVKGHGMLSSNQNRYDPGKFFPWSGYYSLINGGAPPPADTRYWVDTFADAPGFGSPSSTAQTGTLYAGTNYVYCKTWGREIRNGVSFNHWWLKTDLDVGPAAQWVSAYYLDRWGNDEARDNDGYDLPRCEVLPYGKIGEKYYAMGGVRSVLGVPKLAEADSQLGGRFQEFANGIILWHSQSGAFAIYGAILAQFRATGSETVWGFARMDENAAARSPASGQTGRYQYFQNGLFLWTAATGAHAVHGAILTHFENTGREAQYGYPTGEEQAWGGSGRQQTFERGTFRWTPEQGVSVQ